MKMFLNKKELEDLAKRYCEGQYYKFHGEVKAGVRENWIGEIEPVIDVKGFAYDRGNDREWKVDDCLSRSDRLTSMFICEFRKFGFTLKGNPNWKLDDKKLLGVEVEIERLKKKKEGMFSMKNLKMYEGCLIVVDMVNGFVREGVLHDEKIADIIPRQIELIKEAKHDGKLIVFIKDTHDKDAVEFERFGNTKHCVEGEAEAELVDELKEFENLEDAIAIPKNSTCFMEAPLFRDLMEFQKDMNDFDIVGCCTDICVVNGAIALANYLDQNNRKHNIRVHEDAIATYAEDDRGEYVEAAKILMKQQGIELVKKGR